MLRNWSRVARRIRVPTGFLFAAFYLWRARPSAASLAWSLLLVVPGHLLRAYASGYVKKNAELTVTGPYAYTRNPLYLGSALMAFGFAAASRSLWITVLLALLFAIIYVPTIYSEEQFLRATFPAFAAYSQRVPRLLPRLREFRNYCGLIKIARCGFPWQKTTKRPVASVYTNCETGLTAARMAGEGSFSGTLYRQHREYNSLLGAFAVYAVLVATLWLRH
jgi:hypothetical protein